MSNLIFKGKVINIDSIEIEDIYSYDYPDFTDASVSYMEDVDGNRLSDVEIQEFVDEQPDLLHALIFEKQLY